jgi:hypothetical protein
LNKRIKENEYQKVPAPAKFAGPAFRKTPATVSHSRSSNMMEK